MSDASFLAIHMTCLETSCTVLPFYKTLGLQVYFFALEKKKGKEIILTHIDAELKDFEKSNPSSDSVSLCFFLLGHNFRGLASL